MLEPLIPNPKNKKERKRGRRAAAAADAVYREVQRLGAVIQRLDESRAFFLEQQLRLAHDLRQAGVPMEGVVRRES